MLQPRLLAAQTATRCLISPGVKRKPEIIQEDSSGNVSLCQRQTGKRRRLTTAAQQRPAADLEYVAQPEKAQKKEQKPATSSQASVEGISKPLQELLSYPTLFDPIRKPRNPLVLCHGLYGFDTMGLPILPRFQMQYWYAVLKILRDKIGTDVFVTSVPSTGSIQDRAAALHKALETDMKHRDVNLIAHSMGGLDARHLLTHIKPDSYNPLSLTTLSTPHKGSDFMSWCRSNIGIGRPRGEPATTQRHSMSDPPHLPYSLRKPILDIPSDINEAFPQSNGPELKSADGKVAPPGLNSGLSGYMLRLLDSPAYYHLTPAYLADVFNPSTPDREDIKYYSIAARAPKLSVWHPLWLPKFVLDAADQQRVAEGAAPSKGNDGLVPIESAMHGEFLGVVENCDHWALRGAAGWSVNDQHRSQQAADELEGSAKGSVKLDDGAASEKKDASVLGWGWNDVNSAISEISGGLTPKTGKDGQTVGAVKLANWITSRVPGVRSQKKSKADTVVAQEEKKQAVAANKGTHAPLIFTSNKNVKDGQYSLETLYIALCRKLYNEGF